MSPRGGGSQFRQVLPFILNHRNPPHAPFPNALSPSICRCFAVPSPLATPILSSIFLWHILTFLVPTAGSLLRLPDRRPPSAAFGCREASGAGCLRACRLSTKLSTHQRSAAGCAAGFAPPECLPPLRCRSYHKTPKLSCNEPWPARCGI